jgi:transcriptional regulator with XRE-family HTH domain
MPKREIGPGIRLLRRRRGWTQRQLSSHTGVSTSAISRMEHDDLTRVTVGAMGRVVSGLDAHLRLEVVWRGEQLDRLLDADHAALQEAVASLLETAGWLVRVEVSFNHFGDRGRYDILAFQPVQRILLVVEVKTALGDVQDTLGRLDVKTRLAPLVARDLGWVADAAVPALVILEDRTQRRQIERHAALFRRFAHRGRSARAWFRRPRSGASGLLLFIRLPDSHHRSSELRRSPRR